MKTKPIIFALLIFSASLAHGQAKITLGSYLLDIGLYRPAGLFATILGTGVFAITSPMTATATLFPPHDALQSAAEAMVLNPAKFTFARPLGEPLFKSHVAVPANK